MRTAEALAATATAATDHGYPLVTIAGVHMVDVRRRFPTTQQGRTMAPRDPALVEYVSQHHDAAFYAVDPLPGDDFSAELERLQVVYDYHLGMGWGGIGYHTYGFPSGRLFYVGDFSLQRANVAKQNHKSIGHCSAGNFTHAMPSIGTQLVAALATIAAWGYLRRLVATRSHHDVAVPTDPTACCGERTRDVWVPQLPLAIKAIAPTLRAA